MAKYRITFDRNLCIGALPCTSAAPAFFSMDGSSDGKPNFPADKNPTKEGEVHHVDVDEADLQANLDAAQVCPVVAIKVTNLDTGEQIFPK